MSKTNGLQQSSREMRGFCTGVASLLDSGVTHAAALESTQQILSGFSAQIIALVLQAKQGKRSGDSIATLIEVSVARLRASREKMSALSFKERQNGFRLWLELAALWSVAEQTGAPFSSALRKFAQLLQQRERAQAKQQQVVSGPNLTAKLLQWLPLLGIVMAFLMGADVLHTLFFTVAGWACLAIGTVLLVIGMRWQAKLAAQLVPKDRSDGMLLLLTSLGLRAGLDIGSSKKLAIETLKRANIVDNRKAEQEHLTQVITIWQSSGIPPLPLLESGITDLQHDRSDQLSLQASKLETKLLIPLGLCSLPAFVALSVLPLILSIMSETFAQLG